MYTRFITYDLNYADTDDYEELSDLIEYYGGEMITESTYKIVTADDWATFKQNFRKVTKPGDNVKVIVLSNNSMQLWVIR